jgi:hypothetical protein
MASFKSQFSSDSFFRLTQLGSILWNRFGHNLRIKNVIWSNSSW